MTRPVVVLRPQPGNDATAARGKALGLEVRTLPLFDAHAVDWQPPAAEEFDALLLTSAAAVRLGGAALLAYRALPLFAVGAQTAAAAQEAGFDVAGSGESGVAALVPALTAAGHARVLHLGGADVAKVDAGAFSIRHIVVYRMEPLAVSGLAEALAATVALVHSPRAAARLAELVPMGMRSDIDIVAISDAAARAAGAGWRSLAAAGTPGDEAMLALATDLCKT